MGKRETTKKSTQTVFYFRFETDAAAAAAVKTQSINDRAPKGITPKQPKRTHFILYVYICDTVNHDEEKEE